MKLQTHILELKGTSYEVGRQQGRIFKNTPMLAHHQNMEGLAPFTESETLEAGELAGFAQETELDIGDDDYMV